VRFDRQLPPSLCSKAFFQFRVENFGGNTLFTASLTYYFRAATNAPFIIHSIPAG